LDFHFFYSPFLREYTYPKRIEYIPSWVGQNDNLWYNSQKRFFMKYIPFLLALLCLYFMEAYNAILISILFLAFALIVLNNKKYSFMVNYIERFF